VCVGGVVVVGVCDGSSLKSSELDHMSASASVKGSSSPKFMKCDSKI